jgi:1A family penicillin-binding protein
MPLSPGEDGTKASDGVSVARLLGMAVPLPPRVVEFLNWLRPRVVQLRDRVERSYSTAASAVRKGRIRHPKIALGLAAAMTAVLGISIGSVLLFIVTLPRGLPDQEAIRHIGRMNQATAVFDKTDRLAFTIFQEQRLEVPLTQVSPNLVHAVIAIEDQRFYDHHGFDVWRIFSAALANLRHGRAAQGASTITQQLARQSFLRPEKTIRRKLQELILAKRLESLYPKSQILEMYLNKVYFGDGLYGVEAAARGYFGKHASELNVAEAATLAGLVKSPSSYAPTVSPKRAQARRNVVLQTMLDSGSIDRAAWQAARATNIALHGGPDGLDADEPHGQYFKEQVRQELVERFGWQRVYQGGLRVFTTIDMPMQIAAESVVGESLKALEERRKTYRTRLAALKKGSASSPSGSSDDDVLQAALISLDPISGHVLAMVGGRDFEQSHFNRAVQAHRQPGSAFKPFVYATAIEAGMSPATVIDHLDDPIYTLQGAWAPEDEHSSATSMSLRTALRTSSNRAAVRLLDEVGIARTVKYAKDMGIGDLPSVPSLALGSGEVTLQSMTAAYAAFANHGLVPRPLMIRRVEDLEGHLLYQSEDVMTRAISETTAFLMSNMMADVVNAGTGNRARQLGFTLPAAGKTGTTNDFNDAWFVGFTPSLVTGVWVGFDQPHTILPHGFAAEIAVPVWAKYMKIATAGAKPVWFTPPAGVTTVVVCRLSGRLPTDGCDDVYPEYFARGTEPTAYCDLHPTRGIVTKVAGFFGMHEERPAPPPRTVEAPVVRASASATAEDRTNPQVESPSDPPKKKRGFWSKVFGLRKGDKSSSESNRQEDH